MVKKEWVLMILSSIIWIPVVSLVVINIVSPTRIFSIGFISTISYWLLFICPTISGVNILWILWDCYTQKSVNSFIVIILISNIAFLLIGIKILRMATTHV